MEGANRERLFQLCELASKEEDPDKMVKMIEEINHLLEEKEQRLRRKNMDA
jgi:hypothetical protein